MQLRLSNLSLISSAALFSVAIVLLIATIWGLRELREPYLELDKVNETKETFLLRVIEPINQYLSSGDATKLTEAGDGISGLEASNSSVEDGASSTADSVELGDALAELKVFLDGDFRAAGKLSGDPQSLLKQNERETRDEASLLIRYALEGYQSDSDSAQQFIRLSTGVMEYVHTLALYREAYFADYSQTNLENIQTLVAQAQEDVKRIQALPLLGVLEEAEEDFGLSLGDDEKQEDKGIALRDNLGYLIARYAEELNSTRDTITRVAQSRAQLNAQIAGLTEIFDAIAADISTGAATSYQVVRIVLMATAIAILVFAFGIGFIQRSVITRIKDLVPFLERFAEGDFREPVTIKALTVEVQSLSDSSNVLRESLAKLVQDVQVRTQSVNDISDELQKLGVDVETQANDQRQETETISVSIEQMNSSFAEVAQSASNAAEAARDAEKSVMEGNEIVQESVDNVRSLVKDVKDTSSSIELLREESDNIDSVISVIEGIAEQTNLLALNAAIEAARAGEQGRGFAVVAEEVRSLSLRTSQSTQEIKNSIERLQASTHGAVNMMQKNSDVADAAANQNERAGERLSEIVSNITNIKNMNNQIAVATEEQTSVMTAISLNIRHIQTLSSSTSDKASATQQSAGSLQEQASSLLTSTLKFKV